MVCSRYPNTKLFIFVNDLYNLEVPVNNSDGRDEDLRKVILVELKMSSSKPMINFYQEKNSMNFLRKNKTRFSYSNS